MAAKTSLRTSASASRGSSPHDASGEREPLLPPSYPRSVEDEAPKSRSWPRKLYDKIVPRFDVVSPRYRWIPLVACLIIFTNEAEYMTKQVAVLRGIEAMYCIEYYERHDPEIAKLGKHIPENLCKADEIQKSVASTAALSLFVRMLCAMIGNIPLGYIADKKGRRIVLLLHKINVCFSNLGQIAVYLLYPTLPIWGLYFTGLPGLFGGNFDSGLAMLFASFSDVVPDAAQRTTLFFLVTSMQYPAQALCPLLGGWLMDLDGRGGTPEIALFVGLAFATSAALLVIFFYPETIQEIKKASDIDNADPDQTKPNADDANDSIKKPTITQKINRLAKSTSQDLHHTFRYMGFGNMVLISLSVLAAAIGVKSIDWFGLVQYPVIKLHWKFSQSSIAVSIQAVIILLNYAFLLPFYNRLGTKRLGLSPPHTAISIMILSCCLLTAGALVVGFSATVPIFFLGLLIYTLGAGLPVATQAYVSGMVDKSKIARVLSSMAMAAVAGKGVASAFFPKVLAAGLDDGRDFMKGLPMFASAGLFVLALVAIVFVAATAGVMPPEQSEQVDEDEVQREEQTS